MTLLGKTAAIIQTRMGSSRLPGKVLMDLAGKPVLWHVVERAKRCKLLDDVIIATTTNSKDDAIEAFCAEHNISFFRGDEENVLERYTKTAEQFNVDTVVRITSDCPLYDPIVLTDMLQRFDADYMSNRLESYTFPRGLDTEIITYKTLGITKSLAKKAYEKEHVTPYIYEHPDKFKLQAFESNENHSEHRWTLDTMEDYAMISTVYNALYPEHPLFTTQQVLDYLQKNPQIFALNAHIQQKPLKNSA